VLASHDLIASSTACRLDALLGMSGAQVVYAFRFSIALLSLADLLERRVRLHLPWIQMIQAS